ncbi:hypothetical protein TNCV_1589511 [Trichonephila clavipes]|uniref:Uncharacterized protein n=1 Tax=Trichonephila clavipes TaxID=2585209 RepID=A0A8X6RGN3_TRICX|nr:hypothetical protein TNCV_1589511 [Trichonephila clavipes]
MNNIVHVAASPNSLEKCSGNDECKEDFVPCVDSCRSFGVCRWKLLGAVDTRRYQRAENRVWSEQEDHEEKGSKDHAASTCGPHSDSFNDTSRRRRSNCSTNNFQTPCRSNTSAISVHSL